MDVNGTVGGAVPNNDARVQPMPTCSFDCEEQNTDPVMDESVIARCFSVSLQVGSC